MKNLRTLSSEVTKFIYLGNSLETRGVQPDKKSNKPQSIVEAAQRFAELNKDAKKNKNKPEFQKKLKSAKSALDQFIKKSIGKVAKEFPDVASTVHKGIAALHGEIDMGAINGIIEKAKNTVAKVGAKKIGTANSGAEKKSSPENSKKIEEKLLEFNTSADSLKKGLSKKGGWTFSPSDKKIWQNTVKDKIKTLKDLEKDKKNKSHKDEIQKLLKKYKKLRDFIDKKKVDSGIDEMHQNIDREAAWRQKEMHNLEKVKDKKSADDELKALEERGFKKGTKEYKSLKAQFDKQIKAEEKRKEKSLKNAGKKLTPKQKTALKSKLEKDLEKAKKARDKIKDKSSIEYRELDDDFKKIKVKLDDVSKKETVSEEGRKFTKELEDILSKQKKADAVRKELGGKGKPTKEQKIILDAEKEALIGFGESGLKKEDIPREWTEEEAKIKGKSESALRTEGLKELSKIKGDSDKVLDFLEKNPEKASATFLQKQPNGSFRVDFHGVNEKLIGMGHFEKTLMSKYQYVSVYNPKTGKTSIGIRGVGKGNKPGYFDARTGQYIPIFTGSTIKPLTAKDVSGMSVQIRNAMAKNKDRKMSLKDYLKKAKTERDAYRKNVKINGIPGAASLETGPPRPGVKGLLDTIASAEGTRNNYNARFGAARSNNPDFKTMSIDQVLAYQRTRRFSALGRYQFIRKTLAGLKSELGISGSTKFTPELQDKLAIHLLNRRGLRKFQSGQMSAGRFQRNLAHEWASLPLNSGGRTAYGHDGVNMTRATRGRHAQLQQNFASIKSGNQ